MRATGIRHAAMVAACLGEWLATASSAQEPAGLAAAALTNARFAWIPRTIPEFRVYFQAGSYAAARQDSLLARLPHALQHARTLLRTGAPAAPIDLFFIDIAPHRRQSCDQEPPSPAGTAGAERVDSVRLLQLHEPLAARATDFDVVSRGRLLEAASNRLARTPFPARETPASSPRQPARVGQLALVGPRASRAARCLHRQGSFPMPYFALRLRQYRSHGASTWTRFDRAPDSTRNAGSRDVVSSRQR